VDNVPPDITPKEHPMAAIIEITRKPTDVQVRALRTGAAHTDGIIDVTADQRTHEGLVGRGLADWIPGYKLGRSGDLASYCVIIRQGREYLAKLDAVEITRDDVAEGKRLALAYLGFGERRREAEQAPASVVLKGEYDRVRRVMRRAMKNNGAEAAHNALNQYNRTHALLIAARRFDQEDAAQAAQEEDTMTEPTAPAAAPRTEEYEGITRADVAADVATFLAGQPEEYREAFAQEPAIVTLSAAFRQAQRAWCADKRERTAEETAAYNRAAHVVTAAIIFTREDEGQEAATAAVEQVRLTEAVQRAQEDAERTELRRRLLASEWAGAERHGKYLVRTEDRGHGIIAVYVKGPAAEVDSIDRASVAYARAHGLRLGASAGGGEFFEGEYIAQRAYHRA
jgi:hypothetical protein